MSYLGLSMFTEHGKIAGDFWEIDRRLSGR